VFYGHSTRSGAFSAVQAVNVTVRQAQPVIVIDSPSSQVANRTPVQVSGWAVDPAASSGAGVDAVHIYAYPESGAPPIFLGAAVTGFFRLDVAAYLGARFTQSGFSLPAVSLLPGAYTLVVYARSTATGQFFAQTQRMTIAPSAPRINIDTPPTTPPAAVPPGGIDPGTQVSNPFSISGWALDLASSTETGVDVVQAWAYPVSGAAPIFAGTATTVARPDVAAYVGPQFLNSGFQIGGVTLPPGTYTLVVFAHSTVTRAFSITKVVRITVQ
jgi:hypothetical protein